MRSVALGHCFGARGRVTIDGLLDLTQFHLICAYSE